jgi:hypothetical protein
VSRPPQTLVADGVREAQFAYVLDLPHSPEQAPYEAGSSPKGAGSAAPPLPGAAAAAAEQGVREREQLRQEPSLERTAG